MVCHYPAGAFKWNPIEHQLFSFISLNWAATPLCSLKIMLNLIGGPTTEMGLKV
jgi:Rhodopirellula transposase DDE domain